MRGRGWRTRCAPTLSEVRQSYEKQLKELQVAYGEAMLELRARKKFQALLDREDDR
jgi:hypothetical protein